MRNRDPRDIDKYVIRPTGIVGLPESQLRAIQAQLREEKTALVALPEWARASNAECEGCYGSTCRFTPDLPTVGWVKRVDELLVKVNAQLSGQLGVDGAHDTNPAAGPDSAAEPEPKRPRGISSSAAEPDTTAAAEPKGQRGISAAAAEPDSAAEPEPEGPRRSYIN